MSTSSIWRGCQQAESTSSAAKLSLAIPCGNFRSKGGLTLKTAAVLGVEVIFVVVAVSMCVSWGGSGGLSIFVVVAVSMCVSFFLLCYPSDLIPCRLGRSGVRL